ncbi:hypothetical protein [Kitasatospora sp. NPDC058218]|uniref:hypothetical protein n=1 Tax=Kitasatospora sp. NPDC058218 TaxID=3346385 RepID=UPI0036D7CEA9
MAETYAGRQPRTRPGGDRTWPWVLLGVVQLIAAGPMLGLIVGGVLAVTVMGLASGGTTAAVAGFALLPALGPGLGLALPALALLSPAVRRVNRAALFALHCFGLLIGTTVEYVGWVGPAIG